MGAAAEGFTPALAVIYDELLRKEVENRSGQLGESYEVGEAFMRVDEAVLRRAKRFAVCALCCVTLVWAVRL